MQPPVSATGYHRQELAVISLSFVLCTEINGESMGVYRNQCSVNCKCITKAVSMAFMPTYAHIVTVFPLTCCHLVFCSYNLLAAPPTDDQPYLKER